jgi:hypothetical protein
MPVEDLMPLMRKCERLLCSCPGVVQARLYEHRKRVIAEVVLEEDADVSVNALQKLCRARLRRRDFPALILASFVRRPFKVA